MLLLDVPLRRARSLGCGLFVALACHLGPAVADDLQDASKLLKEGQAQAALERVNRVLSSRPKDPQARFLKGLILTDQGNAREAIDIFQKLTQDYPELPEPYNNLAVIFAAQGQYDRARSALEQSIRTHPSYATAYENLGDVYAKLASQAYDKALQLDTGNTGAQQKLALVRELVGGGQTARRAPASTVASAEAARRPESAPAAKPAAPSAPASAPAPGAAPSIAQAPAAAAKPAAKPAEEKRPAPDAASNSNAEIAVALNDWAKAWSRKDVDGYLAFYAKDFQTPGGQARTAWEKSRRERLLAPKTISVSVSEPRVKLVNEKEASVTFRQSYRSDALQANSMKQLVMVKAGERWLIRSERVAN